MTLYKEQRGFSYVEMIVTIAISSIVMVVIVTSVLYFYSSNANILEQSLQVNSARKGVEYLVRDIREATYSEEGAFPVVAIGSTSITFYGDVDRDNSVERVRYFLDVDSNFKKTITEPTGTPLSYGALISTSTVAEFIRNIDQGVPLFTYFNKDGVAIGTDYSSTTAVAYVKVNLIVNVNPTRLPGEYTLRSAATLRNLKTNL